MLEVEDLTASYAGIRALRGVSLAVDTGRTVALIGPNGAGKSTLLNCISGVVAPIGGVVRFDGKDITRISPWTRSRMGLIQVPEGRQVLPEMTVLENLQVGATALGGRPVRYEQSRVFSLFPVLAERRSQRAGSLSGGQQQMLAIGRALMGSPRVLLLDEPSLGLAPVIIKQVFDALRALSADGLTTLLVEQNARQALDAAGHAYIIEQGHVVHSGPSADLANDPTVIAHYLGTRELLGGV